MSGYQQKRKYAQENEYAAAVDDLTFASAFAMMTTPDATPELSQQKEPITDEIKIDEDDISNESADDEEESLEEAIVELESDDESDIDLSEQLSKMENEDQPKSKNSKIAVPKTQNEIDLYNCPVTELEKRLDLDLGISDVVLFHPSHVGIMNAKVSLDRIRLAGNIKFHLASDRTIVVESNPNGDVDDGTGAGIYQEGSHPGTDNSPLLLDEGSLLLLRLRKDDEIISKLIGDEIEDIDVKPYSDAKVNVIANKTCVIPLGKILEVFGPVSKPLYTVRLTKSLVVQTGNQSNKVVPNLNTKGEDKCSQEVDAMNAKTGDEKKESKADINIDKSARVNANVDTSAHTDNAGMEHKAPQPLQDPWSIDGLLTKWVKSMPRLEVYYSKDQCKMMDKQSIVRNSRKACDASNVYDEEVTDTKEMYFSDDEEERNMKRGKKKKNSRRNNNSNYNNRHDANGGRIENGGRMNTMQPQKYQQPQYQQFTHNIGHRQGTLPNQSPPLQQYQHQYFAYAQQNTYNAPPPGPPGTLNGNARLMYAPPPIQPPLGVPNNVPPPPPPPLPQPYHNANAVPVHQTNIIHHSAPQNQSQAYYQQPQHLYPPPYYQQQQYQQQPSQHDQGNSNSNQKNSDTVYYNYS